MERLDLFYKAFDDFRSIIKEDNETDRFRKFFVSMSGKKFEGLSVIYSKVTIETDWIEKLERGLTYVEKAIKEDRQFIRNEGEVLPIEKIRRTSKAGIQDLAKHSNYITHETPDDVDTSIMPDKLLMIQRESDYCVYENKVVYALLVYLKEFVSSRLQRIKDLSNRFEVTMNSNKNIDLGDRKVDYSFNLHEIRMNDPVMVKRNSAKTEIERLDNCMSLIMSFLKTPLMLEVSKAEVISRPITKTNVLRMNINFRESLALFDYVAEYSKDGFKVERIEKSFLPFSNDISNSFADVVAYASFVTYMFGNSLYEELKDELKKAKEREKSLDQEKILAKLRAFEKKGATDRKTVEEYFDLFVEGYKILEARADKQEKILKDIEDTHLRELDSLKVKFDEQMLELKETHENEINDTVNYYESTISENDTVYKNSVRDLNEEHRIEVNNLQERAANEQENMRVEYENKIFALSKDRDNLIAERNHFESENTTLRSQIMSYKLYFKQNVSTQKYVERVQFDELEKLKKAFDKFYKVAWKNAKKHIRHKTLVIEKPEQKGKPNPKNPTNIRPVSTTRYTSANPTSARPTSSRSLFGTSTTPNSSSVKSKQGVKK